MSTYQLKIDDKVLLKIQKLLSLTPEQWKNAQSTFENSNPKIKELINKLFLIGGDELASQVLAYGNCIQFEDIIRNPIVEILIFLINQHDIYFCKLYWKLN